MSRLVFVLSCLFLEQMKCLGLGLDVDQTNALNHSTSSTKPNKDVFNMEISTINNFQVEESKSVSMERSEKKNSVPIEEYISSNIQEISGPNVQIRTGISSWKAEDAEKSPYAVILFLKTGQGLVSCTGTLLTLRWVLTAVSCFKQAPVVEVIIYAGGSSHDEWLKSNPAKGSQTRESTEFHHHPFYHKVGHFKTFFNLALIKADKAFKLSKTVAPVELSTSHLSFTRTTHCKMTSFGQVDLPTTSKNYFRKTQHLSVETPCECFDGGNTNYWVCPKPHKPLSICKGDIGAGLICEGRLKAVMSHVTPATDAKSCNLSNPKYYDCSRVNNTINVFQGTCPCLRFINKYVPLFSQKELQTKCDLEPQDSKQKTTNKPPDAVSRANTDTSYSFLHVLFILVMLC